MDPKYITKRFNHSDIVRAPIEISDAARDLLGRTNEEGRKLLNALSEIFGPANETLRIEYEEQNLVSISSSRSIWKIHLDSILDRNFRAHLAAQEIYRLHVSR